MAERGGFEIALSAYFFPFIHAGFSARYLHPHRFLTAHYAFWLYSLGMKSLIPRITLCWYAKTPVGWRYFLALFEPVAGVPQVRHGWVKDKGKEVQYKVGRYVLRSHHEGRRVYKVLDTCHPRDAVHELNLARRAAKAGGDVRDPKRTIRTAIDAYIADLGANQSFEAQTQARQVLREFQPFCKGADGRSVTLTKGITREMMLDYHKALRTKRQGDRTIYNKDFRIRAWLRWCGVDTKFLPPKPRYEEGMPEIYTPGEIKAILDAADEYMGIALRLALMLGLREQEIMYAEFADVDWHHATFRVQGKKRKTYKFAVKDKEQRLIPIPAEFLQMLTTWKEKRAGKVLILGGDKDRPERHLLRRLKALARKAELNCGLCDACKAEHRKECERWFLHKFRATFCTRMLRETDPRTVMKLAGHSNLETTLAYLAAASGEEMQAAANRVKWTE
jgi:integrase